jgi:hypothetical protein
MQSYPRQLQLSGQTERCQHVMRQLRKSLGQLALPPDGDP